MTKPVHIAFQKFEYTIPLAKIVPQRPLFPEHRQTAKYKQIFRSIQAIGIIEALVVYPKSSDEYLLLDGHTRLGVLKELGISEARCTLATDDEAYTYNKSINCISTVGQHFMILKAIENGVPEERLAEALSVNIKNIRLKLNMLNGICPEAVQLLRNQKVAVGVFPVLRKMKPVRQVEAAEHMTAGATYSVTFAKALLAVTRPELLVKPTPKPRIAANSMAAQEMLGMETDRLVKDLKTIEGSYGKDILALTVCSGFIKKMLADSQVGSYLSLHHSELLEAVKTAIAE